MNLRHCIMSDVTPAERVFRCPMGMQAIRSGSVAALHLQPRHIGYSPTPSFDILLANKVALGTGHCRSNAPHSLRVTYLSVSP